MSYQQLKKRTEGFTIIEVLIVLAIAGLILLIVFLAVPALQRNSRNTQARNEAANILGAVSEFASNNNGKLPAASDNTTVLASSNVKNVTTLTIEAESGSTTPTASVAVLRIGAKCDASNTGTDPGAGRQVALLFQIENNSGSVTTCTSS
jgi:prepilin-type N-terminal cleavage/methylation domain-containing protein